MSARVRVKICGITNHQDAALAVELGADALGFIFYPGSPRYIAPGDARNIVDALPPFITPIAVVVNASVATVSKIMAVSGCRIAQVSGNEPPEYLQRLAWPAVKSIAISTMQDLAVITKYQAARAILLDTKVHGLHGGTGMTFDWRVARKALDYELPIILAGGLTPENIQDAVRIAGPYAIDVGSGVESEPGKKDQDRLRALFAALNAISPATEAREPGVVRNMD
jgi:phosphoribosylanthranilate isomerase